MKNNRLLTFILLFSALLIMPMFANSQIIEVGATGGLSYYIGDINPKSHFSQNKFGWGASLRYYQNSRWAFRFQYSNFGLSASDAKSNYRPERGLSFQNNVNDFAIIAEFNFFDYWTGSRRNFITPYIFGGVSFLTFNPKASDGTALQPIRTEGIEYKLHSMSIPFGIGVKYSLFKRVGVTLEWRIHKSFTDYIDDIHGVYPEVSEVLGDYSYSDPTGNYEPGMQRGNGTTISKIGYNSDWYGILGLTISYKFVLPKSEKCNEGLNEKFYRYY